MDGSAEVLGGSVALFVDGDNLSPALAGPILRAASRLGRVSVRRVCARAEALRGWDGCAGYRMIHAGGAKNGTDLLMCIEAVEMACRGGINSFVLASDDRDFTHLAHWLREREFRVLGLGTAKSPADWRAACQEFEDVGEPTAPPDAGPAAAQGPFIAPSPLTGEGPLAATALDARVRDLIAAEGTAGTMAIGALGARMGSTQKVTAAAVGPGGWRGYLAARPHLYALDPRGPQARVRLKRPPI